MHNLMGRFKIGGMAIRYSQFVPQLYNWCLSLGFSGRLTMPSRAFCSDDNQGYPVMLIAQHFGVFPFDHGEVGGAVAIDRHGPFAHHGEDLVLIQASHVGYDSEHRRFGVYRRARTAARGFGAACGKISAVLSWYEEEYADAGRKVRLTRLDDRPAVAIDNALLDPGREGLTLDLERIIDPAAPQPLQVLSTAKVFTPAPALRALVGPDNWPTATENLGRRLPAAFFHFRRQLAVAAGERDRVEETLAPAMPALVASPYPTLDAARYHTQIEFDRTYRSLQRDPAFKGKNVMFVAGLNIDVSPIGDGLFPLTKFAPWAAYAQLRDGRAMLFEQDALRDALMAQPSENPDRLAYDGAIADMARSPTIELPDV
jgi:hypothetical protein